MRSPILLKAVYNANILPVVNYCSTVWYPRHKKSIDLLQKAQNRFLRLFGKSAAQVRSHSEILTMQQQLDYNDLLKLFSVRPEIREARGPVHCMSTRSREVPKIRLDVPKGAARDSYFLNRAAKKWNSLPESIRKLKHFSAFKTALKVYLT